MPTKAQTKRYKNNSLSKYYIRVTKYRAKAKGKEFNLEENDITKLIVKCCPILGIKMDYFAEGWTKNDTASIDRINNNKGYIKGNIHFVSNLANSMKRNATPKQLVRFAKWVLKTYEETGKPANVNA